MFYTYGLLGQEFPDEELKKCFYNLSNGVHELMNRVDREESRILREREDLQNKLSKRKEEFIIKIDQLLLSI